MPNKRSLTDDQVEEIRVRYADLKTLPSLNDLATEYGCSAALISLLVRGKCYLKAGGPITVNRPRRRTAEADEPGPFVVFRREELPDKPGEVWKPVPGFPEVTASNLGRIRVCGQPRRQTLHRKYLVVSVPAGLTKLVHRLTCMAFHGEPPAKWPKYHAAHCDGDPLNNRPDNLRWATPKENIADKRLHGTLWPTLSPASVRFIKLLRKAGVSPALVAEKFGVKPSTVASITRQEPH